MSKPTTVIGLVLWWIGVLVSSTAVFLGCERLTPRALPLATLLRMTMLFPGRSQSTRSYHDHPASFVHHDDSASVDHDDDSAARDHHDNGPSTLRPHRLPVIDEGASVLVPAGTPNGLLASG